MTDPTRADLPALPEPRDIDGARWGYTADDMHSYATDAYNAGRAAGLAARPAQGGDLERTAPAGYVLVKAEKLVHARRQAKLAADCVVGFAKDRPNGMCGWLDDACTAADLAASGLDAMLAASPPAPAAEQRPLAGTVRGPKNGAG